MKISYKKLWLMLVEKDISRQEFRKTVDERKNELNFSYRNTL